MDDSRKRRLPPWMRGVAASKSDDGELLHSSSKDIRPSNSNSGITQEERDAKETLEVKSILPSECESKRRKRKLKLQDADHGGDVRGTDSVEVSAPKKGRKTRKGSNSRVESREEAGITSPTEDEGELTVEDLMSIAQEYVKADKVMEQHKLNSKECELKSQFPATDFYRNEAGGSLNAAQSNRRLPAQDAVTSHKLTMISAGDGIVSNPSRTGDPAQDMLDLFLGPLLKKPLEEKKQFAFVTEDVKFVHEFKKQCQEEMVPLTKKKSSLKDKVAVFLD